MSRSIGNITALIVAAAGLIGSIAAFSREFVHMAPAQSLQPSERPNLRRKPGFLLTFEQASPRQNPTRMDIVDAVNLMRVGGEKFIILERLGNGKDFIQAQRSSTDRYDFEYSTYVEDGKYKINIFECVGMAKAKTVEAAMTNYAAGGRSWIKFCSWRRVKL